MHQQKSEPKYFNTYKQIYLGEKSNFDTFGTSSHSDTIIQITKSSKLHVCTV